ncbi:hypothetical protein AB1N83_003643 [Pleurotus pulmonarius]
MRVPNELMGVRSEWTVHDKASTPVSETTPAEPVNQRRRQHPRTDRTQLNPNLSLKRQHNTVFIMDRATYGVRCTAYLLRVARDCSIPPMPTPMPRSPRNPNRIRTDVDACGADKVSASNDLAKRKRKTKTKTTDLVATRHRSLAVPLFISWSTVPPPNPPPPSLRRRRTRPAHIREHRHARTRVVPSIPSVCIRALTSRTAFLAKPPHVPLSLLPPSLPSFPLSFSFPFVILPCPFPSPSPSLLPYSRPPFFHRSLPLHCILPVSAFVRPFALHRLISPYTRI